MTNPDQDLDEFFARKRREINDMVTYAISAALILFIVVCAACLTGCGSDYSSPFDAPEKSAQPVDCSASGACD